MPDVSHPAWRRVFNAAAMLKGMVTARRVRWVGEGETRRIDTFDKGARAIEQTLRFIGGTVGGQTMDLPDMPQFEPGRDAVPFVVDDGRQFCPLVGISQGRFHVVKKAATGRERVFTDDFSPVVNPAEIGKLGAAGAPRLSHYKHTAATALAAEVFRAEILRRAASLTR